MMRARARSRGFTLTELMITLTILGIMAAFAVPSFRSFVANQKVKTASYELVTSVMIARSEAIKRNAAVTLAPTSTTDWVSGWSVNAGGAVVHSQTSMDQVTITQKDATKATIAPTAINFGSTGRPTAGAYFEIDGTRNGGSSVKCVKLDLAGIPSSSTGSCS